MKSLVPLAMISGTVLGLSAKGQESRQPTRRPPGSPSAVTLKLRREAAKVATAKFSQLFSTLSDGTIRPDLKLSARNRPTWPIGSRS